VPLSKTSLSGEIEQLADEPDRRAAGFTRK
jgi:hypothetical protein